MDKLRIRAMNYSVRTESPSGSPQIARIRNPGTSAEKSVSTQKIEFKGGTYVYCHIVSIRAS